MKNSARGEKWLEEFSLIRKLSGSGNGARRINNNPRKIKANFFGINSFIIKEA